MYSFQPAPKFQTDQWVDFIGGAGKIRDCLPSAGTWLYLIEMHLGPESDVGRIGSETTILLAEFEIQG